MKHLLLTLLILSPSIRIFAMGDSLVIQPGPSSSKDAMVWSLIPFTNYGSSEQATLTAWTSGGSPSTKRFYVQFDLSSLPSGAIIDSAFLFYYNNPTAPSHNGEHSGLNSFYVRRVTSSWQENTLTFNNQPTSTTTNQVTVPQTTSIHQDFKIDVTTLTQDMLNTSNHGFYLRLVNENTYRAIVCASSDHTVPSLRPKLKVYYNSCTDPEAGFDKSINGNTVSFTDTSASNTIYSHYWDFGDGTFSYSQNPVKTFTNSGVANVCLTITDSCGTDTTCQQFSLCTAATPQIFHYANGPAVQFQGLPLNAQSYLWSFGDGNYSSQQNPSYTYSSGGFYNVCLTRTDSCGTDSTCKNIYVSGIGLAEFGNDSFTIYPNPVSDHFSISGSLKDIKQILIYSAIGTLEKVVKREFELINIDGLRSGLYFVIIKTENGQSASRLIKL